jgi:hypothetical protein
MTGDKK